MSIHNPENQQSSERTSSDVALVLPLNTLDRTLLPMVGGKAANLGELIRAGFSVPVGFCVTTAAYALVSTDLEPILAELATTGSDDVAHQAELAAAAHPALHAPVPTTVARAMTES